MWKILSIFIGQYPIQVEHELTTCVTNHHQPAVRIINASNRYPIHIQYTSKQINQVFSNAWVQCLISPPSLAHQAQPANVLLHVAGGICTPWRQTVNIVILLIIILIFFIFVIVIFLIHLDHSVLSDQKVARKGNISSVNIFVAFIKRLGNSSEIEDLSEKNGGQRRVLVPAFKSDRKLS